MSSKRTARTLLAALAWAAAASAAPPLQRAAAPESGFEARLERFLAAADVAPERTALLVGIDRYPDAPDRAFADLRGCANDVDRFARLLVERFGFEEENVFRLLDEEATHANIVRAFERVLLRRAGEGTHAVFYFSGHGSRTRDLGGSRPAEPTGTDATFVAHDSRLAADGEHDLGDDELRSLLAALTERTGRVLVVTDSCHSGDVLRGTARTRSVRDGRNPLDTEWVRGFWPADVELREDAASEQLPPQRYLHVAAAAPHEQAWELELEDESGTELVHGALTFFLVRALESADPDLTWRALLDDVAVRVASVRPQTVTVRGDADRRVFDGAFARAVGHRAQAMPDGSLRVDAGWLHGVRTGSLLEIRDARGAERLGEATVAAATSSIARANWAGAPPDPLPEGAVRAVELGRAPEEPPLRVHAAGELRELLGGPGLVELVELTDADGADYRLRLGAGGEVRLETAEGLTLLAAPPIQDDGGAEPDALLLEELAARLREELRWRALDLLAAERGSFPLEVAFRPAGPAELAGLPLYAPVEVLDAPGDGARAARVAGVPEPPSEELSRARKHGERPLRLGVLEVRNPHARDLYLHVLSLEESRARTPIAPARGAEPELLPAGATRTVLFGVRCPRDWPLERPMRDRYLVLATTRPCDLTTLAAPAVLRSAEEVPEHPVPPLLELAFRGRLTRGSRARAGAPDWGVSSFDLWVEPPRAKRSSSGAADE